MPQPTPPLVEGLRRLTGGVALVAVAFSQAPGRIVPDTKLDLLVDPGRFLGRSLQAWDPTAYFGQLQNQAYGYLFPMGPFFWLGHTAGIPPWVVQRLWWSVLLLVAYLGFLRLAGLLGIGTPTTRLVGALAYALGPRVVTELGAISVELLPLVLLPWVLVPLVVGARAGSVRRAAAWSGLAVACMGGVNAAAVLAVLVLPLLWLLSREPGPRRTRLLLAWLGSVALAVAWWFLPLLVLGRYAYPFLSYIENAGITTSVVSGANVLRGTDHWLGFAVIGGQPGWPAGFALATTPVLVVATVTLAGIGAFGVAHPRTRERRFLGWGVLVGAVLVGVGFAGTAGSPVAQWVRQLLDGPLAPLRNVHKFDPVLRLPLTLGLSAALVLVPAAAGKVLARIRGEDGDWLRAHPFVVTRAAALLAVVPLVLASSPAWTGGLAPPGSFPAIPSWWSQTADWLARHDQGGGRALLEPASAFADYVWGSPRDEPLQTLARSPWVVRDAVPLGAPGATRLLDGIESLIATGRGSPDLVAALRRAGVDYVVLRNDLAPGASATPPAVARAALLASPGLSRVVGFGDRMTATAGDLGDLTGPLPAPAAVEIWAVAEPGPVVSLLPGAVTGLSGGPEALAGSLAVDPGTPLVALADGAVDSDRLLVTDTLRRRALNFGAATGQAYGPTLPAAADPRLGRPAADVLPYDGVTHQTTSQLSGALAVTATSSSADPFTVGYRGPAYGAVSAFDGDPATAWVAGLLDRHPSVRVTYAQPVPLSGLVLRFEGLPGGVARPPEVTVVAGGNRVSVQVTADRVPVPLTGTSLTVEIDLAPAAGGDRAVGLAGVDGLPTVATSIVAPADSSAAGPQTSWDFVREPDGRRACVLPGAAWVCSPEMGVVPEETGALSRTFTVGTATTARLGIDVTPRPGAALDTLLDTADGLTVTGSSELVDDPADRPGAALDGDAATAWMTTPDDPAPRLAVDYGHAVTLTSLTLVAPTGSRRRIVGAVLRGDTGTRVVTLGGTRTATFPALTTARLTVTLQIVATDAVEQAPVVVTDLLLGGAPVPGDDPTVTVPCGSGPGVTVDGRFVPTSVTTTRQAVMAGGPVAATPCDPSPVPLPTGGHQVAASSGLAFSAVELSFTSAGVPGSEAPVIAVAVRSWSSQARTVLLPAPLAAPAVLVVDEGFNVGWTAEVGGRALHALRVDGWRQGWVVPAGTTGVVGLRYGPGRLQLAGLLLGLLALAVLAALAARHPRRKHGGRPGAAGLAGVGAGRSRRGGAAAASLAASVLIAGPTGVVAWVVGRVLGGWRRAASVAGLTALLALGAAWAAWASAQGHAVPVWLAAAIQGLAVADLVIAVTAQRPARSARAVDGAPGPGADAPPAPTTR